MPKKSIDMTIFLPTSEVGEVGEDLPAPVIHLIRTMATVGWWPLSFGEEGVGEHGDEVELMFCSDTDLAKCRDMAEFFIKENGAT